MTQEELFQELYLILIMCAMITNVIGMKHGKGMSHTLEILDKF